MCAHFQCTRLFLFVHLLQLTEVHYVVGLGPMPGENAMVYMDAASPFIAHDTRTFADQVCGGRKALNPVHEAVYDSEVSNSLHTHESY